MKNHPLVAEALLNDHVVMTRPKLIVEFNNNRYMPAVVTNETVAELDNAADPDTFPIDSIIEPHRPHNNKIGKLMAGEGTVFSPNTPAPTPFGRYYFPDVEDKFKYWISQDATDINGNFPTTSSVTNTVPKIVYQNAANSNKIRVQFMNTWASPSVFRLKVQYTNGGSWTTIASSPSVINNDGAIELYYNGTGWTTTFNANYSVEIWGIKLEVDSMGPGKINGATSKYIVYSSGSQVAVSTTGKKSRLHLIEMGARLVTDLSEKIISTGTNLTMSEDAEITPVGTISSNTADVQLENFDDQLSSDNVDSYYYGMLEKGAKVNLYYEYFRETETGEEIIGVVPEFEMYSQDWQQSDDGTVTLAVRDESEYLQTIDCPTVMCENMTVPAIAMRLLDASGYSKHNITNLTVGDRVPIFWSDGTKSLYEVLNELAAGTQTAMYFDANGVFQIKTREQAFTDNVPDYQLTAIKTPTSLPNIVTANEGDRVGANVINVEYSKTEYGSADYKRAISEKVWEPENDVVLRAAPLVTSFDLDDPYIRISTSAAASWPFTSKILVEGEIIGTYGKVYSYRNGSTPTSKIVYTLKEQKACDELTNPEYRSRNYYTGNLAIGVKDKPYADARGMDNTAEAVHSVSMKNYTFRRNYNGTPADTKSYTKWLKEQSMFNITTTSNFKKRTDNVTATTGTIPAYFGTKLTLAKDARGQREAGLVVNFNNGTSGSGGNGYYITVQDPNKIPKEEQSKGRTSLTIYTRIGDDLKRIGGANVAVVPGIPIQLDVTYSGVGVTNAGGGKTNQKISVRVNGVVKVNVAVPVDRVLPRTGSFGMVAVGDTNVNFEYLYGTDNLGRYNDGVEQPDDNELNFGFNALLGAGIDVDNFRSVYLFQKGAKSRRRVKKKVKNITYNRTIFFFDEFGPVTHEVREFNAKYDPAPVQYAHLYMTNNSQAIVTEFNSNPFGATFQIVNMSRSNALIHGQEANGKNNVLTCIGRSLVIADSAKITEKNEFAVRRDGEIKVDFTSPWIQNEEMAQELADWMKNNWSSGVETMDVEVFGNPLIELGDVVSVNYPEKFYFPATHKFFVVGIRNNFSDGLTTTLSLRRRVD